MFALKKILVVDESEIILRVLEMMLRTRCAHVLVSNDVNIALSCLANHSDIELVLAGVGPNSDCGFQILKYVSHSCDPKPHVIITTSHRNEIDRKKAVASGALAYLTRPITMKRLSDAWVKTSLGEPFPGRAPRKYCEHSVCVVDAEDDSQPLIAWQLKNISETGAFIETRGPVEPDTELHLLIEAGGDQLRATASVVRIQEPSWNVAGGIGVQFSAMDESSRSRLNQWIDSL
jgi:CheY-like chemotaxis protein